MIQLSIVRQFFDQVLSGEKTKEFRDDSAFIQTLCGKPYFMLKNGRSNKSAYMIIEIVGHSVATLDDVKQAHGEESVHMFKTNTLRAIHLGKILEIWDPKTATYLLCQNAEELFGPVVSKTVSPDKHARREPDAGPLPFDLHVNQLVRRDLSQCESQTLLQAFQRIQGAIDDARLIADESVRNGHRPMLWEFRDISFGTRFTGIGSVEEAMKIIETWVPASFKSRYGCDSCADAYNFTMKRFGTGSKDFHFFRDVMDLAEVPDDIWKQPFPQKLKIAQEMPIKDEAFCNIHKRQCKVPKVDLDVSGSVCKDYSAQGKKQGTDGAYVVSMLTHFEELRRRGVPIRLSENVVSVTGQVALQATMPDSDVKYLISMPEDCGFGAVRRDRGWLAAASHPFRFFCDPNIIYHKLASRLAEKQIPQSELWFEDDVGLRDERLKASGRFRTFKEDGSLHPSCSFSMPQQRSATTMIYVYRSLYI